MQILRNIIIVILLLTLAAIAVVGVMVEFPKLWDYTPDRINALGRSVLEVMRPGYLLFMVWWLILLGLLLVFLITVARPRRRMKIEVQMGGGRVVIMDAAIKKYIRNALSELGEVTVKKIDLREHRNLVTTDITADVRTRENLPTLERRIISRVRTALAEDLGITNLGDVHVFIRNFEVTGRPIKPAPAPDKVDASKKKLDDDLESDDDLEAKTVPPINDDTPDRNSGIGTAAGAGAGGAAAGHALADPIEPEGSDEPIVISDSDAVEATPKESGLDDSYIARETADQPGVTESSDSDPVILAEKDLSSRDDYDTPISTDKDDESHRDLDHPVQWGTPADDNDDRDKDDKGPLPL